MFYKKFFLKISVIVFLFSLFTIVHADSNGIWVDASDIQAGVFGNDEGLGVFEFSSDLLYKGIELDNRYINVGENDSITANMVAFNYAGSPSEGGDATNALLLNGANWNSAPAITSPSFTDSDNSAFVVDPSSYTTLAHLSIGGLLSLSNPAFYSCSSLSTNNLGIVTCSTDDVIDNDSVVGNEYPLAGTGILVTGGRTVNADTTYLQRRVSSSCPVGSSIRLINQDGSVVCETDDVGSAGTNDTNAGTICTGANTFLNGNGVCVTGYLDSDGYDAVNDSDSVVGNEYPLPGTGITVTSSRTVNVDTSLIATRSYVDNSISSLPKLKKHFVSSQSNTLNNLIPGEEYIVSVYGIASDTSGIKIESCSGSFLAKTSYPSVTGRGHSDSATLGVVAPSSGCIKGYTHGGTSPASFMFAWTVILDDISASWQTGSYGSCTCSGTQTRSVDCVEDSTGDVVNDIFCDASTKPSSSRTCTPPSSCSAGGGGSGGGSGGGGGTNPPNMEF